MLQAKPVYRIGYADSAVIRRKGEDLPAIPLTLRGDLPGTHRQYHRLA